MKLLSLFVPISVVLDEIIREFSRANLQVLQSFDLQSARDLLTDPNDCSCDYHGTDNCTCQYVVLMISHMNKTPVTLVVHGHYDWTRVTLVQPDESQLVDETTLLHIQNSLNKFEQFILDSAPQ